jgi:predicted DNA-binding transcriptional regulator AlpA
MTVPFLTTTEAAALLGLQPRTLERWRWAGCGPRFKKLCGAVRYSPSDVMEWAAAATRRSTSDAGGEGAPDARG